MYQIGLEIESQIIGVESEIGLEMESDIIGVNSEPQCQTQSHHES